MKYQNEFTKAFALSRDGIFLNPSITDKGLQAYSDEMKEGKECRLPGLTGRERPAASHPSVRAELCLGQVLSCSQGHSAGPAVALSLTRRWWLELGLLLRISSAEDFRGGLLPTLNFALKGEQVLNILLFQGAGRAA